MTEMNILLIILFIVNICFNRLIIKLIMIMGIYLLITMMGDNFSKHKLLFQAHNIFCRRRIIFF